MKEGRKEGRRERTTGTVKEGKEGGKKGRNVQLGLKDGHFFLLSLHFHRSHFLEIEGVLRLLRRHRVDQHLVAERKEGR
jgi:hypothetical protein